MIGFSINDRFRNTLWRETAILKYENDNYYYGDNQNNKKQGEKYKMCNSCNCEGYEQCSIVGYMPVGFCCTKCTLYNDEHTCLESQNKVNLSKIELVSAKIEEGALKVVVKKDGKGVPLVIDLEKQLGSKL